MNLSKVFSWPICILILICIFLAYALYLTNGQLEETKKQLSSALKQIEQLNIDNDKLIIYIKQKDTEIKKIENEYLEKLEKVPSDICGDVKPSVELLNYLKGNLK